MILLSACALAYAGEGVFTVSSNGVRVIFASENFKQDAVLPNTDDFHLFGWSGRSRYHVTDFYGVAFVRANGAYAGDFLDWGTLLADQGEWRTLTADEWTYVLTGRDNAADLVGEATIDGQKGMILLPDTSTLTIAQAEIDWLKATEWGAVFLPYQGYRDGVDIVQEGEVGYYWTSTSTDSKKANYININNKTTASSDRYLGCSVRLVKPVCQVTVQVSVNDATMGTVIFKPQ